MPPEIQSSPAGKPTVQPLVDLMAFNSRLEFLYKSVEDTQNTIRFLDTKAAFCVTLLSGIVASVIELMRGTNPIHPPRLLFAVFLFAVALSLAICMRVIFPTIKPHASTFAPPSPDGRRLPKFFIGHNKHHSWVSHTLRNTVDHVLSEDTASHSHVMATSRDADLLEAMCEEVILVSLVRQIKSDRLHAAMFSITICVGLFVVIMLL